jgi:hypothetical protein
MIPPAKLWKVPVISKALMILAAILGLNLYAQQPSAIQAPTSGTSTAQAAQAPADQQPESDNDMEMQIWLNENDRIVDHLITLGVDRKIAESINSRASDEGPAFLRWQTARAGAKERFALLFFPCHAGWDSAYLYTLSRQEGSWRATDYIELDCHYDDNVSFEIAWIRDPNRDEVLVHHACAGHGTGLLLQDFQVYIPFHGKLKPELDTLEVLKSSPIRPVRHDLVQRSTFAVIPVRTSRSRDIEETRSSLLNDRLTVQRRIFRWNPAKGKYIPSAFTAVEAPPN